MPKEIRIALVGGSDSIRTSRRQICATVSHLKVVFDSDGFGISPSQLLDLNFDVAVIDLRLDVSALDLIKSLFVLAKIQNQTVGRILIASQFSDLALRLEAIRAGAVDVAFVSDGMTSYISKIDNCADEYTDFAIREILPTLDKTSSDAESFQKVSVALDSLDVKEAKVLKAFCQLKSDSQIAIEVQIPKQKVRQIITKVQNILLLDTRSQLLLRLFEVGALAL